MKKILVVDDEESLQEMLKDILTLADFDVVTANNGEEGLKKMYETSPDLVILDCSMPVMDGYETLQHMRNDPTLVNKPVIMLSVRSGEHDEIRGLNLGVDDYITKPFKASLLIARVKAILERNEQSVGANPLTMLSGNAAIKAEVEERLASQRPFAMIYIDLNSFKSFNDTYGFERGDEVIKFTASTIIRAVREAGTRGDFIGHIGGDDFITIVAPEKAAAVCEKVIALFDGGIPQFYNPDDRQRGYIVSVDRSNVTRQFPLMSISLAVVSTLQTKVLHYGQLSEMAAELKKLAKQQNRSAYVVNRRRE